MLPWKKPFAGRLDENVITSKLLEGNLRGDPHERPLWVYVPPGYDESKERLPSVYVLQGWTGQIDMWRNRAALRPSALELFDDMFAKKTSPPAILVFVDAWTSWGGSQFLDSPALGRYHSYLCEEIVPWVDAHYRTLPDRAHRAVSGKSSGGYGAMVTAMLRPDLFGALATHCGDGLFELSYAPGFPKSVRSLRDEYAGSYERFLADFGSRPAFSKPSDFNLMSDWSMASCYSADADGTVRLPYDTETGEIIPAIWQRWLDKDPVRMARVKQEALASMRAIWIDSGKKDEWFLDLAAQGFHREAKTAGAKEIFFELYDAGHMQVEYRYPLALHWLIDRIGR